jgi:hypothetical protein
MGKGRNKRKAKQNTVSKPLQSVNMKLPQNMSAEEMQHIIARAIVEAEEIKTQKAEEQSKIALAEWHATLGYKEYQNKLRNALNKLKVFFNILFLPKKYIKGDRASAILLKSFISLFFWIMKWCSLLLSILLIVCIPIQYFVREMNQFPWQLDTYCIPFAFVAFVFSRLFRMASAEIDKLDDRNYLFGLFASITSLVSIIIAVIAIIKGA